MAYKPQYYPGNTSVAKNRRKQMADDLEKLRDISDDDLTAILGHRAPGSDYPSTHPPLSEIGEPDCSIREIVEPTPGAAAGDRVRYVQWADSMYNAPATPFWRTYHAAINFRGVDPGTLSGRQVNEMRERDLEAYARRVAETEITDWGLAGMRGCTVHGHSLRLQEDGTMFDMLDRRRLEGDVIVMDKNQVGIPIDRKVNLGKPMSETEAAKRTTIYRVDNVPFRSDKEVIEHVQRIWTKRTEYGFIPIDKEPKPIVKTHPSMLYYDVHSANFHNPNVGYLFDYRLEIPGFTIPNTRGAQIVELRGWIHGDPSNAWPNPNDDPADFSFGLELDPEWLDKNGVDMHKLIRVGNIITDVGNPKAQASPPVIKVELMSWHPGQKFPQYAWPDRDVEQPERWDCMPEGWNYMKDSKDNPEKKYSRWPWNPRCPSNAPGCDDCNPKLNPGDYVRIVGALVTDTPHEKGDFWAPKWLPQRAINPARWTEIHPPDLIEILLYKAPKETVRGVAVFAESFYPSGETSTLNFDILPPPKPTPSSTLVYKEHINNSNTNYRRIKEGNNGDNFNNTGAKITVHPDKVNVRVVVEAEGGLYGTGAPGKFNAIYRVFWEIKPYLRIAIEPHIIMAGTPTQITVHAEDWISGESSAGKVRVDNNPIEYDTDTAFDYTFHGDFHRVKVSAPGYPEIDFAFYVYFHKMNVKVKINGAIVDADHPAPLNKSVDVIISVTDNDDGHSIEGATIRISNPGGRSTDPPIPEKITDSNGQASYTQIILRRMHHQGSFQYPVGEVIAPDYEDTDIDFGFPTDSGCTNSCETGCTTGCTESCTFACTDESCKTICMTGCKPTTETSTKESSKAKVIDTSKVGKRGSGITRLTG